MVTRKKQMTPMKKFLTVSISLIVMEVLYLEFFAHQVAPVAIRDAIEKAVEKHGDLSDQRLAQLRIQLALADFKAKNDRFPEALTELVPTYFDSIPDDPDAHKPFPYKVVDGRYTLGDPAANTTTNPNSPVNVKIDPTLLASLEDDTEQVAFIYNPAGKRDPFQPFDFSNSGPAVDPANPLTAYDYGQLRLASVLQGFDNPIAIVENGIGRGFTVRKGTKIGRNGGEVVEIRPDKLLILETTTDFTGAVKNQTVELKLHTSDEASGTFSGTKKSSKPK